MNVLIDTNILLRSAQPADSDDVDQSFRGDGDQRGAKRREAFSV